MCLINMHNTQFHAMISRLAGGGRERGIRGTCDNV